MPKVSDVKTESAPKSHLPLVIVWVVVLLLVGAAVWWYGWSGQTRLSFSAFPTHAATQAAKSALGNRVQQETGVRYDTVDVLTGGQEVTLDIADTPAKQELGLGKRTGLAPDRGMLFIYDKPANPCFWMKGMQFPIDIVWLDAGKKVIQIEENVSPDTYPQTFCSAKPAQYVIELFPGAAKAGFKVGDKLPFDY
jgi:uncharacterized membrane protein (UPF0127 family)